MTDALGPGLRRDDGDSVIAAQAAIQGFWHSWGWVPACAGMTEGHWVPAYAGVTDSSSLRRRPQSSDGVESCRRSAAQRMKSLRPIGLVTK